MTRPLALLALVLALSACGEEKIPNVTPSFETTVTSSPTPSVASPTPKTSVSPQVSAAQPTGPRIAYFRVKTKPSCPSSGPGASFPGNPIELEWKVTGGPTQVTISIDGPGIFGTYSAEHVEKFPFACPAPGASTGTTQKHTYLLKVVGHGSLQQTVTGEARAN